MTVRPVAWIGIDAGKAAHHAAAVDEQGRVCWSQKVPNDLVGSPGGIAPPGSHRTEREPLGSLRSSHRNPASSRVQAQWANSRGSRSVTPDHHRMNLL